MTDGWPMILFAIDRAGICTSASGRGEVTLKPSSWLGRSLFDVLPTAAHDVLRRALWGESLGIELEVDGALLELQVTPLLDAQCAVTGAMGVALDVTQRKRAEEQARQHLWFLDAVIESLPNMIFVKDAKDLRFIRFNRAGETLLGYRRDELIGKNDYDFFPKEQADFFTAKDRAVLDTGQLLDIPDERIQTRAGGERTLHTRKIPIYSESGQPLYLLGISEDITERQRIDAQRRELERLKSHLVANVSHELRTPLTLIIALTDKLLREQPTERALEHVQRHARALQKLVSDWLDLSKLEAGEMHLDYADVDLAAEVRSLAGSFEVLAAQENVTLTVAAPAMTEARVDPEKFSRIVANLLSNALKHVPRGGMVSLVLEDRGERVRLSVSDNGVGVPEGLQSHVFERFFQVQDVARESGTGLGLAIVKEFAVLHGGTVSVEPAPSGGASFIVELPKGESAEVRTPRVSSETAVARELASVREAIARRPPEARTEVVSAARVASDRALVLVVDDNAEMNRVLVDTLSDEHRVESAFDGVEGLERALALQPDLILTDVMMPKMSGDELVRKIRAHRSLDRVPIVLLTARADERLLVDMLRSGAQDYLTKPFSLEEVRARVRNLVQLKTATDFLMEELSADRQDLRVLTKRLAERDKQLKSALDEAKLARDRAERASRLKSEFLGLVAHEVRTPMTALGLRLQALERLLGPGAAADPDGESSEHRHVRKVSEAAERLYDLVDALLRRAALENGRLQIEAKPLDLRALLVDLIDELQPRATKKGISLRLVAAHPPPLVSDAGVVRVIISNLVTNAVKFTTRGSVTVTLTASEGTHRIEVADTGPGIAAEHREQLFEPFVQLTPITHKHEPGLGLGLALVHDLVEAIGGRVSLVSELGRGSTFVVTLPSTA